MICDLDHVARLFHVTEKAIRDWIRAGMPVHKSGRGRRQKTMLKLEDAIEWYFANNYEKLELERSRARLANEQAESAKLKNELQRGDSVSLRSAEQQLTLALSNVRTNTLAIPTKLAPLLENRTAAEIKATLEREIRACLEAIADFKLRSGNAQDSPDDQASAVDRPAAARVNGKRVG